MSKQKFSGSMNGKGYYIALILCAVAIGISGYLYYRNTDTQGEQLAQQVTVANGEQQNDVAAVASQADPSADTNPTQNPRPEKRMSPVSGETVAEYAVDALSYNQTTRDWRTHNGIDIAAAAGTAVCAAADGTVYTVYEDDTMGMTVVIRHTGEYTTRYSSLAQEVSVAPGDNVKAGQTIGYVGTTALLENAIGEHVHFSVSCGTQSVDPAEFLAQE